MAPEIVTFRALPCASKGESRPIWIGKLAGLVLITTWASPPFFLSHPETMIILIFDIGSSLAKWFHQA
jgi:hypothetical protein